MDKVMIEITPKEYTIKVILDEKEFIERHVKTLMGSECVEGNFESEEEIYHALYDALNDFYCYHVMNAL